MNDSAAGGTGIEDPSLLDQQMLVDAFDDELEAEKNYPHPESITAVFRPEVRVQLFKDGSMRLKWNWAGSIEQREGADYNHESIVADYIDLLNQQRHGGNHYSEVRSTDKEVKW